MSLRDVLDGGRKPLVLDGGFGTMVQGYGLGEEDFRGYRYRDIQGMLSGNNEMLNLTRPDVVSSIYDAYVLAGVDLLTANTFSANAVSQSDYNCQHLVAEMNREAVRLARECFARNGRKGFVIGTVGPTNKSLSISPDINDPACRSITFDCLTAAYREQMQVLVEAGVDAIMMETVFDTLNAKAGIFAAREVKDATGHDIPLMMSVTVNDSQGRLLSGQTLEAFLISVSHAPLLSIGLNCSFGADEMLPILRSLRKMVETRVSYGAPRWYVSCHPNAGLPNAMGQYDVNPESFVRSVRPMIEEKLVDIIGGCCGTTPEHIRALRDVCR